ncbi:hypothetical protein PPYR_02552 [Photinus pyralis]|uniref:Pacifastin domain-containing protein n=1 Tax=Photinus pyralis TaxID=7054 RepID=A0A5N4B7J6_PHOPY|nr:uncharacterized protein LOC116182038 [Photinus pyralis]KAB0805582.1 hypothetical protein PPYR_02552 [Photinus pyralis]
MNFFAFILLALTLLFYTVQTEATICAPFSNFKIDCDDCQCSEDGTQYSCEVGVCGSAVYLNENSEDGNSDRRSREADGNAEVPYINDEIPPPRQVIVEDVNSDDGDDTDDGKGYNFYIVNQEKDAEPLANTGEEENMDDNAAPPIPYRFRRSYPE